MESLQDFKSSLDEVMQRKQKKLKDMSFKEIRNLKIFQDNKDEILKKAFEEAKLIEKKRASFEFDTVVFKVNYTTNFGEMVS